MKPCFAFRAGYDLVELSRCNFRRSRFSLAYLPRSLLECSPVKTSSLRHSGLLVDPQIDFNDLSPRILLIPDEVPSQDSRRRSLSRNMGSSKLKRICLEIQHKRDEGIV